MSFEPEKVAATLKIEVSNPVLYETAFTHRSYLNEHSGPEIVSNERLEFLGDAVLQLLSSEHLFKKFSESPEGDLTNYRSAIVCTQSIAEEARRLGYGTMLRLSNGEEATGGREREYILANTFEAVLGAIYLDKGLPTCREFVERELFYKVDEIIRNESYKDAKSRFQEVAQEKYNITPNYQVMDAWGPDHEKMFKVSVFLNDKEWGTGEGRSKQKAEQQAAEDAIKRINA